MGIKKKFQILAMGVGILLAVLEYEFIIFR